MQARINAMVQVGMHNKDVKGDAVWIIHRSRSPVDISAAFQILQKHRGLMFSRPVLSICLNITVIGYLRDKYCSFHVKKKKVRQKCEWERKLLRNRHSDSLNTI